MIDGWLTLRDLHSGSEAALASFSGPLEVRLREELPNKATLEIVHRPLEGVGGGSRHCAISPSSLVGA